MSRLAILGAIFALCVGTIRIARAGVRLAARVGRLEAAGSSTSQPLSSWGAVTPPAADPPVGMWRGGYRGIGYP